MPTKPDHNNDEEMLPYFDLLAKTFDEFYKDFYAEKAESGTDEVKLKLSKLNSDKEKGII